MATKANQPIGIRRVIDHLNRLAAQKEISKNEFSAAINEFARVFPGERGAFDQFMAKRCGASKSTVDRWLNGATAPVPSMRKHVVKELRDCLRVPS